MVNYFKTFLLELLSTGIYCVPIVYVLWTVIVYCVELAYKKSNTFRFFYLEKLLKLYKTNN